jgi:tetratricopeptide (TPR) repeat protein
MRARWLFAALLLGTGCKHTTALSPREQAVVLMDKNRPDQALPLLEEVHAAAPDDLDVARWLVEAHVKTGKLDALIARLQASSQQKPVTPYMLGLAQFAKAAAATPEVVQAFERAVALAPKEAELHYRLGLAQLESEQYAQALPDLERAHALAPDRAGFNLPLARAYHRTGNRPAAIAALKRLIEGRPSAEEVKVARALMAEIADPFDRFPQAARARLERGLQFLHTLDVPQEAIVAFEEINRDFPDLAVVHALLGLAYQRIDDAGRAVDELRRAIELAPEDGQNHLYLAQLYLSRQRPKQAQEHLERAVALHPLLFEAYAQLGELAMERSDPNAAAGWLAIAARLQPDSAAAVVRYALALQAKGDLEGADRELRRANGLEPESLEVKLRLGVLHAVRHARAKSPDAREAAAAEATRWLEEVLSAQPENAIASRALQGVKAKQ